jgi:hypothetical protein
MKKKFVVGQELWFEYVDNYRKNKRAPATVTIEKVGNTWLYLSNGYRVYIDTLIADGGGFVSQGRAYIDKEARLAEVALIESLEKFRRDVGSLRVKSVTKESIEAARTALGLDEGELA